MLFQESASEYGGLDTAACGIITCRLEFLVRSGAAVVPWSSFHQPLGASPRFPPALLPTAVGADLRILPALLRQPLGASPRFLLALLHQPLGASPQFFHKTVSYRSSADELVRSTAFRRNWT